MNKVTVRYFDTDIQVCDNGDIEQNGIVRKHYLNADGYPVVSIKTPYGWRSIAVHILIATAFVPNDDVEHKTEVNHIDFDRTNWNIDNLEWISHSDNVKYSSVANRHARLCGTDNPNYGNNTLHEKYAKDKMLAKEKQSRPRGRNGNAKKCVLVADCIIDDTPHRFNCRRDAADFIINLLNLPLCSNREHIIKQLKRDCGYYGWYLYDCYEQIFK